VIYPKCLSSRLSVRSRGSPGQCISPSLPPSHSHALSLFLSFDLSPAPPSHHFLHKMALLSAGETGSSSRLACNTCHPRPRRRRSEPPAATAGLSSPGLTLPSAELEHGHEIRLVLDSALPAKTQTHVHARAFCPRHSDKAGCCSPLTTSRPRSLTLSHSLSLSLSLPH
jgi:hypothetical protein